MREYKRLKRKGYIPIKEYNRFILFININNGIRTTLHKADLNKQEAIEVFKKIERWENEQKNRT